MNRRRAVELGARLAAIVAPVACAAYAIAAPTDVLFGGSAWLVVLAASIAGYGHLAERAVRVDVDLGLRMAWGAALYLAVAGVLLALGTFSLVPMLVLIVGGYAAYVSRQLRTPRPAFLAAIEAVPRIVREPAVALFFALLIAMAAINIAGAVAETDGNTYDDDVVYTPLIKRALDTGDLDEPFSFRRISAYGGQTALNALAAVRGSLANIYLMEGGLLYAVALLLVLGLARDRDRALTVAASRDGPATDRMVLGLVLLVLVMLPNTSINTGTYWAGVVMFLALYRTAALTARSDVPHVRVFACVGTVAAAACTLRQNCIAVAVLFPLALLLTRLGRDPRTRFLQERRYWLATIAAGAAVLLPYFIAAWRSNHTFLFPLIDGTFNPEIQTTPIVFSAWQELQFFIEVLIEPEPIRVMLVLAPVLFLTQDRRAGRPLTAFTIATVLGFAVLIHSFTLSDQNALWRYAFAFVTPLFIIFVVEAMAPGLRRIADDETVPVRTPVVGRVAIIAALLIQLVLSARGLGRRYMNIGADLERAAATAHYPERQVALELAYADLQRAAPAGAAIAVALDQPYFLDYDRNPIFNLDTPGFASLAPGMPFFRGPEPVAEYFLGRGIRYLAFVRGEASRYQYRREMWLRRIYLDVEWFRVQAAYAVDCVDNFAALAASRGVLHERDGMVLLDLGTRR